jgi:enoyl-CoA hydratase/carnithine racemase
MTTPMDDLVLLTRPADGVALLTLNRPQALNALNQDLRDAICERLGALAGDRSVRAVVITGDDRAFVAGADLKAMATATPESMAAGRSHVIWDVLSDFEKPLIAAVRGFALGGGCELALACDIIIAGESAKFGLPEIKVGVMPGAGGLGRMIRSLGRPRAMLLALSAENVSGRQAADWGLVSEAVADDRVLERALSLASVIAAFPAGSTRAIKAAAAAGDGASMREALAIERRGYLSLLGTADQREGANAFLEKRRPNFNSQG